MASDWIKRTEKHRRAWFVTLAPVVFAINTGRRLGEILNLKWEEADLARNILKMMARKNRQMLEVPLYDCTGIVGAGVVGDAEMPLR